MGGHPGKQPGEAIEMIRTSLDDYRANAFQVEQESVGASS